MGTGVPCPYNLVWTRLGGGALGVEGHYLLGNLFYVGDAEEGYFDLRGGVVGASCAGGLDYDVAGAVGALAMIDADDVGGSDRFYQAGSAAGDDHNALVGDGVDGAATFQEG